MISTRQFNCILCIATILVVGAAPSSADDRTFDGQGNNVANPTWGAAFENFLRLDAARYADGISTPSGATRPNVRDVSNAVGVQNFSLPDADLRSDYVWQWGQFLDHDITLSEPGTEQMPITVNSPADPLFPVIPLTRSGFDSSTGTSTANPRQQVNEITAYVDGSMIYGSSQSRADALRTMSGGLLKTSSGGTLLPFNTGLLPNANDSGVEPDNTLFLAGDVRANEQLGLTSMHTLFVREHNRLAGQVASADPTLTDEQIYQRTRKLIGGIVQNITYKEYLPALIGSAAPSVAGASYDSTVDATLSNEFVTAAFRLGHTQVSDSLNRVDNAGNPAPGGAVQLMDAFFQPSFLTSGVEVDYLLHGLATQVQQTTDTMVVDSLRNALFGAPGSGGLDLLAINLQRGRDHGLGTLVQLQTALGVTPASTVSDITSDPALQSQLMSAYGSVAEIDLWVGLLAEDALAGSALGSTMSLVVAQQFERLLVGDRFFYTWDDDLSAADVSMIMKTSLSDVIMRNTDIVGLQENVFFVPEPGGAFLVCFGGLFLLRRRR